MSETPTYRQVVIVARHHDGDPLPEGATGITECGRCRHDVALIGAESTKVAAGTWAALCQECGADLADEHPEMFIEENFIGRSEDIT